MPDLSLDHVLIAVRDLDASYDTFQRLGFKVTPEGRHPGRGTSNRLVVFPHEYIELITVHDAAGDLFRPNLPSFLSEREGLFVFSIGTDDVRARAEEARSRGARFADPVRGSRQAADGSTAYSWTQAELGPDEMPGSQTFLIQHDHTIEDRYTEPKDPTHHPNGARGIESLALAVEDATTAAMRWQDVFGLERVTDAVDANGRRVDVRLRFENCWLDFTEPHGRNEAAQFLEFWGEGPYAITFECQDVDAAESSMRMSGVLGLERRPYSLTVPPQSAHGARMVFAAARGRYFR